MALIPILGFSAYSGTGKTTLIEKLIVSLRARGLRVAVIKHDVHGFELDKEGKDSWRFTNAGAELTVLSSAEKTALIERRALSFAAATALVHDVDIVLVEGYKQERLTRIGVCRKVTGKDFPDGLERYAAVVTDLTDIDADIPRFGFDDIPGLTEFIVCNMKDFTQLDIRCKEQA